MIYFKFIDIPNLKTIQRKVYDYLSDNQPYYIGFNLVNLDSMLEKCPELSSCLDHYNLKIRKIATYITKTQENSRIHVDYKNKNYNLCRINIPIHNCEGSYTEFYTGGRYQTKIQKNGLHFQIIIDPSEAIKVAELELIRPAVLRIQEPHRVQTNLNRVPRIALTLFTDLDPVFLLNE